MTPIRILILAALVAFAGCASYGSVAPGESADQVRSRLGSPSDVWKDAGGAETWEYRTAPAGWYTYMIDFGPDHAVRGVRQVLSDEYFAKIQRGMPREEVHRLLGGPKQVNRFSRSNQEVWTWRFKQDNHWYRLFLVQFDESTGTVLGTYSIDDPTYYDKGGVGKG